MKLFRKKNKDCKELHPFIVRVLLHINNTLKVWATWLQQKTNSYSTRKRKIILILFCTAFVTESIVVVYQSFQKNNKIPYSVTLIQPVRLLKEESFHPLISEKEFNRIHRFKIMLDSLQITNTIKFDSLLSLRPHLMDSIHLLENIYYEQQKNRP
jgi:hypothetical protein